MPDLVYRHSALTDLDAIYDYIGADNPHRAASFVDEIRARCRALCTHPELGPKRDDIRPGLRILPMRSRVVIAYRLTADAVVILRVFYSGGDCEVLRGGEL